MTPLVIAEIVGELPDVLIQDIVDGEWLMPQRGVGHTVLTDFDRWKRLTERFAEIPKLVIAGKEAIRPGLAAAVELQCKRVELVIDGVPGILEGQARFVRPAPCIRERQRKGVRR